VIHQETFDGMKEYFRKKRENVVATWITDANGIVHIPLAGGFEAIINEHRKVAASQFTWRLKRQERGKIKYYVEARVPEELRHRFGNWTFLHRVVLGAPDGIQVDHINGDGLNCLDANIRLATVSQNASNRRCYNKLGIRGVSFDKTRIRNPYVARIKHLGKTKKLGNFPTAEDAGKRYDQEAILIFGNFAILNNIP
jgi:hypothetical protein